MCNSCSGSSSVVKLLPDRHASRKIFLRKPFGAKSILDPSGSDLTIHFKVVIKIRAGELVLEPIKDVLLAFYSIVIRAASLEIYVF